MDIKSIENEINGALAAFQRQDFQGALATVEKLSAAGISHRGLWYVKACCEIALERFQSVLSSLNQELLQFPDSPEAGQLNTQINQVAASNPTLACLKQDPPKVLLCGLAPGDSGTGRFLASLLPISERRGYRSVYSKHIGFHAAEKLAIATLRNATILILHPQNIGWELVKSLFDAGNTLRFYVLDNSFFCIRSFNFRPGKVGECLDCVGNVDACHSECKPFPVPYERGKNLEYLRWMKEHSDKFEFFCQSNAQRDLVLRHFGPTAKASTVGMLPSDLLEDPLQKGKRYDIVFHADSHAAKGLHYTLELAKRLPELSVLVPCSLDDLRASGYSGEIPPSVTVESLRWHTGLRDKIMSARLVFCPSQWSAAVEGALLKSLQTNGNVAVFKSEFGFSREIPDDVALQLGDDLELSATKVREFLGKNESNRERARAWLSKYVNSVKMERIFE